MCRRRPALPLLRPLRPLCLPHCQLARPPPRAPSPPIRCHRSHQRAPAAAPTAPHTCRRQPAVLSGCPPPLPGPAASVNKWNSSCVCADYEGDAPAAQSSCLPHTNRPQESSQQPAKHLLQAGPSNALRARGCMGSKVMPREISCHSTRLLQHHDLVALRRGGQAVGHQYAGAATRQAEQRP